MLPGLVGPVAHRGLRVLLDGVGVGFVEPLASGVALDYRAVGSVDDQIVEVVTAAAVACHEVCRALSTADVDRNTRVGAVVAGFTIGENRETSSLGPVGGLVFGVITAGRERHNGCCRKAQRDDLRFHDSSKSRL